MNVVLGVLNRVEFVITMSKKRKHRCARCGGRYYTMKSERVTLADGLWESKPSKPRPLCPSCLYPRFRTC